MGQVTVIDNFLTEKDFKKIQDLLTNDHFPWYFNNFVTTFKDSNNLNEFQFTHTFFDKLYPRSEYIEHLDPVISALNPVSLVRVKANLQTKTDKIIEWCLHTDNNPPLLCKTAIYYLNTNNGYTRFESGEKIQSKENRMIIFDGDLMHAGTTTTDSKTRILLNFNFYSG